MKKVIPVIVAIVLIILIAAAGFGAKVLEKYSYSKERADLTAYFGIEGSDDVPIILQDERIEEHARVWDNVCYFDVATVHKYFNDRFYEDKAAGNLLYTMPEVIYANEIGTGEITVLDADFAESSDGRDYTISRYEGETLYIAADYVKEFANFSYEFFAEPNHMQIYT
ncbi:MAG: chitinase, partial [Lachnospiraceae bacterium]|nr:chitinase [Lachnospiraceae bacterium]